MSRFAGINQSEVDYGAIAQLGERLPCTQEVGGSIPPGSTTFSPLLSIDSNYHWREGNGTSRCGSRFGMHPTRRPALGLTLD